MAVLTQTDRTRLFARTVSGGLMQEICLFGRLLEKGERRGSFGHGNPIPFKLGLQLSPLLEHKSGFNRGAVFGFCKHGPASFGG